MSWHTCSLHILLLARLAINSPSLGLSSVLSWEPTFSTRQPIRIPHSQATAHLFICPSVSGTKQVTPLKKSCSDEPRIPDAGEQERERNCGLAVYHQPWHRSTFSGFSRRFPSAFPPCRSTHTRGVITLEQSLTSIDLVGEFMDIQGSPLYRYNR